MHKLYKSHLHNTISYIPEAYYIVPIRFIYPTPFFPPVFLFYVIGSNATLPSPGIYWL